MNVEYFRTLFDYNYWARDRLLAALEGISEADFGRQMGFSYGSIRGILTHCLEAEYGWRSRFEGRSGLGPISDADTATPSLLAARWREEEALMRRYLEKLTESDLASDFAWRTSSGDEVRLPNLWLSLAHVINHSTQHRSEAAEALTMIGRSPGDLDLGDYAELMFTSETG